jgi:2-polyprenyl-6-methoxyphenol hydroxylase-like FAD-dependent oxidoreductase
MRIDGVRVVVVGAATGGAAAALLLARAGAQVTVLERVAELRTVGAGIAIADNGMAVLESLGLGPALSHTPQAEAPRIVDASGRTLFTPPRGITVRLMRRSTLQRVLLDALDAEPRVSLRLGADVAGASGDGRVRLRADGREQTLEADFVVAADGVHSTVRDTGAFGARAAQGIRYVRTLLPAGMATGVEAWTPAGIFGSFDVDDGTYVYASAGGAGGRAIDNGDLGAFREHWARAYPRAAALVEAIPRLDDLIVSRVTRIECARWHDGAIALVGDAAHAMAPNLGQGANSALVDAAVLLDELRRAPDREAALTAYTARRRPAVRAVAAAAARIGALSELTHPAARWARDRLLLPVAQLLSRDSDAARILQEPPHTLLAIGRA